MAPLNIAPRARFIKEPSFRQSAPTSSPTPKHGGQTAEQMELNIGHLNKTIEQKTS